MSKIAIVRFQSYNGKWSDTTDTLYFASLDQAVHHLQDLGYTKTQSVLTSREDQWDLDYATSAQVEMVELTN
jgi:hypothetical protein